MTLNKNNYYSTKNKYLTASRIKDYKKDKFYFYRKHVLGELKTEETPSMRIGSAVDCWLTQSKAVFQAKFKPCDRRNLKNPPANYTELTPAEWDRAFSIASRVEETTLYKEIKDSGYKSQNILHVDQSIGIFKGLAGIPDWYKVDGSKAIILDLKTTNNVDVNKFTYTCREYGYYLSMAYYEMLIKSVYPDVKECSSYLFAVENDDVLNRTGFFLLDPKIIELEKESILEIIDEIKDITEFKPTDIAFKDAILI